MLSYVTGISDVLYALPVIDDIEAAYCLGYDLFALGCLLTGVDILGDLT